VLVGGGYLTVFAWKLGGNFVVVFRVGGFCSKRVGVGFLVARLFGWGMGDGGGGVGGGG